MAAVAGATLGAAEKARRVFGEYLEEIGLPADRVLDDPGPAEIEDVISFFYAGMPDRYKDEHEAAPLPEEHWCQRSWPRALGGRVARRMDRLTRTAPPKSEEGKVAGEREPFWYYDAEDDDFERYSTDEDLPGPGGFRFGLFGCCFPERCRVPDPHSEGDCVGVEMMEDLFAEASDEEGDPS